MKNGEAKKKKSKNSKARRTDMTSSVGACRVLFQNAGRKTVPLVAKAKVSTFPLICKARPTKLLSFIAKN